MMKMCAAVQRSRGGNWNILGTFEGEMETICGRGCCKEECQDRDKSDGKGNSGLETSKSRTEYRAEMKK